MNSKLPQSTIDWLDKVARINSCSREEVLRYLDELSSAKKVIHHLRLA